MGMREAVDEALGSVETTPADAAVVELARAYADVFDDPETQPKPGPQLLACLDHLLLTPKSRAAITKEIEREPVESPLDELRARRAGRARED